MKKILLPLLAGITFFATACGGNTEEASETLNQTRGVITSCGTVIKQSSGFGFAYEGGYTRQLAPQDGASTNTLDFYKGKGACIRADFNKNPVQVVSANDIMARIGEVCGTLLRRNGKYLMDSRIPVLRELAPQDGASSNTLSGLVSQKVCIKSNWSEAVVQVISAANIRRQ